MNSTTELVFILDRGGSMHGLQSDTIGGFNAMIDKQRKEEGGDAYVTTVLFDTRFDRIHDRLALKDVPVLTEKDYVPGGCTALLDAVGDTIRHIADIHRYARPEDVPGKTVFVITTDGFENVSRRFSLDKVKEMIRHEQEKYGWEFLFLGANIDAVEAAGRLGIREDRTANFHADSVGMAHTFSSMSEAVTRMRRRAPLRAEWKKEVEADFSGRGKDPRD